MLDRLGMGTFDSDTLLREVARDFVAQGRPVLAKVKREPPKT